MEYEAARLFFSPMASVKLGPLGSGLSQEEPVEEEIVSEVRGVILTVMICTIL